MERKMNYYKAGSPGFNWSKVLTPFLGILLTIVIAMYFDRKQADRARKAEAESTQNTLKVLEDMERNLNKEIVQHYEKIDSLIYVRDSVISEHSTKTVTELQRAIDSVFNGFPDLSNQIRGR